MQSSETVFHVARNGVALGEMTTDQILALVKSGGLSVDDLAWNEGMPEWQPLRVIPAFSSGFESRMAPPALPKANAPFEVNAGAPSDVVTPPLASRAARFFGNLFDAIVFVACALGPLILIDGADNFMNEDAEISDFAAMTTFITFVGVLVLQIVLLSTRAQSVGKILVGTRIHDRETMRQAGFVQAVLLRYVVGRCPSFIPYLGQVYWFVDACLIFRADRRCLHDLIAGTIVCRAS